jgi:hypothetical protein
MSGAENQFSLTRVALIPGGAAKKQFSCRSLVSWQFVKLLLRNLNFAQRR